jgi:sigma-B regulation protein RsbU (phosphoserine phosphatase)
MSHRDPPPRHDAHQRLRRFLRRLHEIDPRQGLESVVAETVEIVRNETGGDAAALVVRRGDRGAEYGRVAAAPPAAADEYTRAWSDVLPPLGPVEETPLFLSVGETGYPPLLEVYARMGIRLSTTLSAPLNRRGVRFGFLEVVSARNEEWGTLEGLDLFETLMDEVAVLLDNVLLLDRLRRERLENELLYSVSQQISLSLDSGEVLNSIIDSLGTVIAYDSAAIWLLDARTLEVAEESVRGYRPEMANRLRLKVGEGIVGWAAKTGQSIIVPDVRTDPRYVNARDETRAEMVAPLKIGGEVIGVFNLESNGLDAYTPRELRLLETFASQAAVAIERSRHLRQQLEKERLDRELSIARRIQLTFLPERDPDWPGFDVSGYNITSEEVSGDFFDYIPIAQDQWGVVIADVSGKGVPASLIMASLRAALWTEVRNTYSIADVCARMNNFLYESLGETEFVTAVYGVIDLSKGLFTYSNGGHFPPVVLRASGELVSLEEGGLPFGAFPDAIYPEGRFNFAPGDVMLLYTDGAVEARNPEGEEFGRERLMTALEGLRTRTAREIRTELVEMLREFTRAPHFADDLTFVVLRRR